jgi:hypothetical protein
MSPGEEYAKSLDEVIEMLKEAKEFALQGGTLEVAFQVGGAHGILLREWSRYAAQFK